MNNSEPTEVPEKKEENILKKYNPFKSRESCMECRITGTVAFSVLGTWAFWERYKVIKEKPNDVFQRRVITAAGIGTLYIYKIVEILNNHRILYVCIVEMDCVMCI